MYTEKIIETDNDVSEWLSFVGKYCDLSNISIAQNPILGKISSKTFGYIDNYSIIKKNDNVVGVYPKMQIGSKSVSIPHFSYGDPIFIDLECEKFIPKKNEIRSYKIFSRFYNDEKVVVQIELPESIEILQDRFKSKLKSQIKKGYSYNPKIYQGGLELLDKFYHVYSNNMHQLGSPPLPICFFSNLLSMYKYGKAKIVLIEFNDKPVASGFTLSFMGFEEVCWASSDHAYNRNNFNMVLYWEMIKDSILDNNRIFSFGRSSKGSNTLKFKLQWGEPIVKQIYFNRSEPQILNLKNIHFFAKLWKLIPYKTTLRLSKFISKRFY